MTLAFTLGTASSPLCGARCVSPRPQDTDHATGLSLHVCVQQAQRPSRAPAALVWPAAVPQNTAALIRAGHLAPDKSSSVAGIWPSLLCATGASPVTEQGLTVAPSDPERGER